MPLPTLKTARQCKARCKSTKERCKNPAAYGMPVCRMHGARKRSTVVSGRDHPSFQHGQSTKEVLEASKRDREVLNMVRDILKKRFW